MPNDLVAYVIKSEIHKTWRDTRLTLGVDRDFIPNATTYLGKVPPYKLDFFLPFLINLRSGDKIVFHDACPNCYTGDQGVMNHGDYQTMEIYRRDKGDDNLVLAFDSRVMRILEEVRKAVNVERSHFKRVLKKRSSKLSSKS